MGGKASKAVLPTRLTEAEFKSSGVFKEFVRLKPSGGGTGVWFTSGGPYISVDYGQALILGDASGNLMASFVGPISGQALNLPVMPTYMSSVTLPKQTLATPALATSVPLAEHFDGGPVLQPPYVQ